MYKSPSSTINNNELLNQTTGNVSKLKGELLLSGDLIIQTVTLKILKKIDLDEQRCSFQIKIKKLLPRNK